MTELRRPRHISAADWARMPWHARERAVRLVRVDPRDCGTVAGWMRHRRAGEPGCKRCLKAWNAYTRARKAEQRERLRRQGVARAVLDELAGLQPCGTHAAFVRHRKYGETPCDLCREAERTYQRERSAKRRRARHSAPAAGAAGAQVAS